MRRGDDVDWQRRSQADLRIAKGLLAGAALNRALIRLQREARQTKDWQAQPRAPAGQSDGGQWVSTTDGADGSGSASTLASADSTTLDDGTRVLSIRIHAGRKDFDEQHAVIAPDGESRIFETSGDTQAIRDGETGEVLSRTTFTPTELVSEPVVQSTFAPVPFAIAAGVEAIQAARTIELALSLFTVLSARKDGFGTVLGLTAHEFVPGDQSSGRMTAWVGQLS